MEEKNQFNSGEVLEKNAQLSAQSRDYFLPISIVVAGLMISGSIIYVVSGKSSVPNFGGGPTGSAGGLADAAAIAGKEPEIGTRDAILGDPEAPVTIIEYGDYQCPFCGKKFFSEVEPLIRENYINTGKVRMIYRNFSFLGPESTAAAEAAECAKDQKKFWAYHDEIFKAEVLDGSENNGNLTRGAFLKFAKNVGLDVPSFTRCIDNGTNAAVVQTELEGGKGAGVDSTPTFFVNGQQLRGALPYNDDPRFGTGFKTIIDAILKPQPQSR